MSLIRPQQFTTGTLMVGDDVTDGDVDYLKKYVLCHKYNYDKIYVPFRPANTLMVTADDLVDASQDSEVQYLIPYTGIFVADDVLDMVLYVFDEDKNKTIAMTYKNVVMVSCEFPEMCAIFGKVADALNTGRNLLKRDAVEKKRKEMFEKRLYEFVQKSNNAKISQLESQIERSKLKVREYSEAIVVHVRDTTQKEQELEGYRRATNSDAEKRIKGEMQELLGYDSLADIEIEGSTVKFYTNVLSIKESEGRIRPLGRFMVQLNMEDSEIRFFNLENRINRSRWRGEPSPHPHVGTDGRPCLGNLSTVLPELVASYDMLSIWQVVLSFLQSYNAKDSWGKRVKYWDRFEADGVTPCPIEEICACCCAEINIPPDYDPVNTDYDDRPYHTCDGCGVIVCPDCIRYNEHDDAYYCTSCHYETYCDVCDTHHGRGTDFDTCSYCDDRVCVENEFWSDTHDRAFCNHDHYLEWCEEHGHDPDEEE